MTTEGKSDIRIVIALPIGQKNERPFRNLPAITHQASTGYVQRITLNIFKLYLVQALHPLPCVLLSLLQASLYQIP